MNHTSIEWVQNPDGSQGYTWNPITGCLNGCEYCYARKLANGRVKHLYLANENLAPPYLGDDGFTHSPTEFAKLMPFYPRFWPERLEELDQSGDEHDRRAIKHRGIFVCDMSDLFGIGVPTKWTESVMELIRINWKHRFYLLTKQPQNLAKFSPFPDNCYVGVTATDGDMYQVAQYWLEQIEAKVKYISFEPLLDWHWHNTEHLAISFEGTGISWIIIGAQTQPVKKPEWQWVKDIIEAADTAGIPVFLKNNLGLLKQSCEGAAPFYREHSSGTMELLQNVAECSKSEVPV